MGRDELGGREKAFAPPAPGVPYEPWPPWLELCWWWWLVGAEMSKMLCVVDGR